MFKRMLLGVLLVLLAACSVLAHDTWIDKQNGELLVLRGHGGKAEAYDSSLVKEAKGLDAKGHAVEVQIKKNKENAALLTKGDPAIAGALYDSGYWLKTTDGWKKATKREGKGKYNIVESLKSKQYCKNFQATCSESSKPMGQRFEVIPQKDPMSAKVGDKLAIKVLFDGKPVEGAIINVGGGHGDAKNLLKTDKSGMANVTIEKAGLQLIKAGHKIPLKDDPDADVLSLASTVTFTVK